MWYGIGNTVIANPSTMRDRARPPTARFVLQRRGRHRPGHHTVMPQMAADALGRADGR
jgi:hypothetical protein